MAIRIGAIVKLSPVGISNVWQTKKDRALFRGKMLGYSKHNYPKVKWNHHARDSETISESYIEEA